MIGIATVSGSVSVVTAAIIPTIIASVVSPAKAEAEAPIRRITISIIGITISIRRISIPVVITVHAAAVTIIRVIGIIRISPVRVERVSIEII
jgi:hypothetical protein